MDNRFLKIKKIDYNKGPLYNVSYYPEIPLNENDIYVQCVSGDRLDNIANQFYGDSSYYWIIFSANPDLNQSSFCPKSGTILRIPTNINKILEDYNKYNS